MSRIPDEIVIRCEQIEALERQINLKIFQSEIETKQDELLHKYGLPYPITAEKAVGKTISRIEKGMHACMHFTDNTKLEFGCGEDEGISVYRTFREWEMPKELLDEYIVFLETLISRWKEMLKQKHLDEARKKMEEAKLELEKLEKEHPK